MNRTITTKDVRNVLILSKEIDRVIREELQGKYHNRLIKELTNINNREKEINDIDNNHSSYLYVD